jgi:hypothetical protein
MLKKIITLAFALMVVGLAVVPAQDTTRMQQIARELEQAAADFAAGRINAQQFQQRANTLNQQMEDARRVIERSGASLSQAPLQRIETLLDQDKSLEAQFNEKRITEADYTRQANAVRNELNQIIDQVKGSPSAAIQYAEVEGRIKKLWPGSIPGWPSATVEGGINYLEIGGLNRPIRQAAGTRASYNIGRTTFSAPISSYIIYQSGANQAAFDDLKRQIENITGQTMERMDQTGGLNGYRLYVLRKVDNDGTHWYHYHEIILGNNGTISYVVNNTAYD